MNKNEKDIAVERVHLAVYVCVSDEFGQLYQH